MSEWRDHTLDDPAGNYPCSEKLEGFVREIGWQLRPEAETEFDLDEIVRRLCSAFHLRPPITGEKIRTFLEEAGIYHEVSENAIDTTLSYHGKMTRWEIHTRPCMTYDWSREVWHEVWEILFWRCFHAIPWWKQWAKRKGYYRPHDKADEFAFLLLLSSGSVPAQAKKRHYDVYGVANHYTVPTSMAFWALRRYTRFSHPLLMAVIRLDVQSSKSAALTQNLFEEYKPPATSIYAQVYYKVYKPGYDEVLPAEIIDPQWQSEHHDLKQSFKTLSQNLSQNSILCVSPDDPMYQYCRQEEAKLWKVQHIFGVDLPKEVSVITRQSPRCSNEIFLQVVPCGYEADFLPSDDILRSAAEQAKRMINAEWHQAAKKITKGSLRKVTS